MSSFNHIQFRFIRKADFSNNSGSKDDVVTIKHVENNLYSLNYLHRYQGEVQRTYSIVKEDDVGHWLRSLLTMVGFDKDPFYRIQVDLPHYPSVLFDNIDLRITIESIMAAVQFSIRNLPPAARTVVQSQVDESHGLEGEEEAEEAEEAEEGEYDDMPGLIPIPTYKFDPAYEGRRHLFLDHEEATSAVTHDGSTPV